MSSFNNITKIKYADNASDLITLDEYIVFRDDKAQKKYIVFKFVNNVTQQLLGMEFEVSQYNVDGELIEKSVVVYNKFLAGAEEEFVPKAKLRVSFRCETISIHIIKAAFDRFVLKEGEIVDNVFKFEHFYREEKKNGNDGGEKNAKNTAKTVKQKKVKPKKVKKGFVLTDATNKNRAVFPVIFNVIVFVLVIAFVLAGVLYVKFTSKKFTQDDYLIRVIQEDEDKKSGEVAIYGYVGDKTDVVIPAKIGDYTVTKIDEGAFTNSEITSVTINCELTISTRAFVNCQKLEWVYSDYALTLKEQAFVNCPKLRSVSFKK